MEHSLDITALANFNLVATHGGFGRASRASGQPKATLSRHVRALEESLGVRLVERGGRGLKLTPEGAILHARTVDPFGEIVQVAEELKSGIGRPRGVLRVSVPLLFAHTAMGRLGAAFLTAHPEVRLEVTAEDRLVDLVGDGYDVVVRFNPRPDDALVGRRFLSDQLVLVAPPDLRQPYADAAAPGDIELRAIVRTGRTEVGPWTVVDAAGCVRTYRPRPVLCFSTPLLIRNAVLAGAGAAMVPRFAVAEDIAARRVVEWGVAQAPAIEGWVLHASRRLVSPKVSAFVDFLCRHFT
ncbi:UNVERIFIED_ORG: DNA-binding transcriptional LysR family regulator [Burkholderia sp. 1263]|jgi:DNA-binding transcriptional LysR family regulator|uniref:LysR family transcriptional regulator n=1 Tax=Paraburkholderia terricola TaxID=169427 RepID=UPI002861F68C|nr:LysR family transcriptional regulator [Paraburkholderia terricola]MDR6450479.1 DNA-binding transcriptional LysR family regulator [Paraburkholderia terricola]